MRNFKNNRRRYRSNSFDRNIKTGSNENNFNSGFGNISEFRKKNYNRNNVNGPKLIQKYSSLAREALSNGDKILYENYMQHAEHFIRVSDNLDNSVMQKKSSQNKEIDDNKFEDTNDDGLNKFNQVHIEKN
tara:strand:+ start:314 stop:706 length:393 start_codon:yes stop_codon:yes gene_type:complete